MAIHIIPAPSGRYIFVGLLPAKLGFEVKASKADVAGGRAYKDKLGNIVTTKFPSFETAEQARDYAANLGYQANIAR